MQDVVQTRPLRAWCWYVDPFIYEGLLGTMASSTSINELVENGYDEISCRLLHPGLGDVHDIEGAWKQTPPPKLTVKTYSLQKGGLIVVLVES